MRFSGAISEYNSNFTHNRAHTALNLDGLYSHANRRVNLILLAPIR
jgi:hypothetical protein